MKSHIPEEETTRVSGNFEMNLYDVNKQIIAQLADLNETSLEYSKNEIIIPYLQEQNNEFYMLLCRDINYYTLFQLTFQGCPIANEIIGCAQDIGSIKAIDVNENNAIEIWVQPVDGEPVAMYLFPYDGGVIKCTL